MPWKAASGSVILCNVIRPSVVFVSETETSGRLNTDGIVLTYVNDKYPFNLQRVPTAEVPC